MSRQDEYKIDHWLAKLVIAILVCSLLIAGRYTGYIAFDVIGVFIWFFGVNVVAYIIEIILHHRHKHRIL